MNKTLRVLINISAFFFVLVSVVNAAPRCDNNQPPALRMGDPACFTSVDTRYDNTKTCTVNCHDVNECRVGSARKFGGACNSSNCAGTCYVHTWCSDSCHPERGQVGTEYCTNNGGCPDCPTETYETGSKGGSLTQTCHYLTVDSWSECNGDTGTQTAIAVTQHTTNGTNCDELNEDTTKTCQLTMPLCSITFLHETVEAPASNESVTLTVSNDADNKAQCNCDSNIPNNGGNNLLSPGTYSQSFSQAGYKNCTCTVENSGGQTNTCSGSVTVTEESVGHHCTGGNPPNGATWCAGDDQNLTSSLSWQKVNSCTDSRKCEYTMPHSLPQATCGSANRTVVDRLPSESALCLTGHSDKIQVNGPNCHVDLNSSYTENCYEWYCTSPELNWVRCAAETTETFKYIGGCASSGKFVSCQDEIEPQNIAHCNRDEYDELVNEKKEGILGECKNNFVSDLSGSNNNCDREFYWETPTHPHNKSTNCDQIFNTAFETFKSCLDQDSSTWDAHNELKSKYEWLEGQCVFGASQTADLQEWYDFECQYSVVSDNTDEIVDEGDKFCQAVQEDQCGPADDGTYKTSEEVIAAGRCNGSDAVVGWLEGSNPGLAANNGIGWKWKCNDGSADSNQCKARKPGVCALDAAVNPNNPPYNNQDEACKFGAFNSVKLVQVTDPISGKLKDVLKWKCGTGDSDKKVGSFITNNSNTGNNVPADDYGPKEGGVDCQCKPEYKYECVSTGTYNCSGHCGELVDDVMLTIKKDTACFPNEEAIIVHAAEYETATQKSCSTRKVRCAPCGAGENNSRGGIWHETN